MFRCDEMNNVEGELFHFHLGFIEEDRLHLELNGFFSTSLPVVCIRKPQDFEVFSSNNVVVSVSTFAKYSPVMK